MVMMNCAGSIVHAIKKHTIAGTRSPAVPSERQGLPKEPSAVGHQPSDRLRHGCRTLHECAGAAKSMADMILDPPWPTPPTAR